MTTCKFRVTYDVVTYESAMNGDTSEGGYVTRHGWRTGRLKPYVTYDDATVGMSLRQAMRLCHPQEDNGRWWSEVDGRKDYATGAEEYRSIHPPRNITPSSYRRVSRILGFKVEE